LVTGSASAYGRGGGRVLMWNPTKPGADPVELGHDEYGVSAMAVLPDGQVVTSSKDRERVQVRNVQSSSPGALLVSSAYALATSLSSSGDSLLFIGHVTGGISCWEVRSQNRTRMDLGNKQIT
jgi:hypothetical protein